MNKLGLMALTGVVFLAWISVLFVLVTICADLLQENNTSTLPVPIRLMVPAATLAWGVLGIWLFGLAISRFRN